MRENWIRVHGAAGESSVEALIAGDPGQDASALEAAAAAGVMGLLGSLLPAGLDNLPDFAIAELAPDGHPRRVLLRGEVLAHCTGPGQPDLVLHAEGLLPWRDAPVPAGYATLTLSPPQPPPAWLASGWQMPSFFGTPESPETVSDDSWVEPLSPETVRDDSWVEPLSPEQQQPHPPTEPDGQPTAEEDALAIGALPVWGAVGADAVTAEPQAAIDTDPGLLTETTESDESSERQSHVEIAHVETGHLETGQLSVQTPPPSDESGLAAQTKFPPETQLPPETELAHEPESPHETEYPHETEFSQDTEFPHETDVSHDTEFPQETEFPHETEYSHETEYPHQTEPSGPSGPEQGAGTAVPVRQPAPSSAGRGEEPSADLTLDRDAAGLVGAAADSPLVLGVLCPAGHPSAAHASHCRVCDREIPAQQPFQTPRPTLGVLTMSTGDVVPVDRGILLGRAPKVNTDVPPAARPHVVRLPSPQKDISRNHVEIVLEGWHVLVKDLGSTNGTTITLPGEAPLRLRPNDPVGIEIGTVINVADEVSISFEAVR